MSPKDDEQQEIAHLAARCANLRQQSDRIAQELDDISDKMQRMASDKPGSVPRRIPPNGAWPSKNQ